MKKIVGLSLALILIIGMMSAATYAFFVDTETSSANQLVAGTLDLKTNNVDGVSQTLYATAMAPGDTAVSSVLILENNGTTDGGTIDIVFSYKESDGNPNSVDKTADEVAAVMEITSIHYASSSLLGEIDDINSNGYPDVEDLKNTDLTGLSGITAASTQNFDISVTLRSDTGNDFQADGIDVTMTFTLKQ
jgi:spore coat-associated protein N